MVTTASIKLAAHLDDGQVLDAARALANLDKGGRAEIAFVAPTATAPDTSESPLLSSAQRSPLFWAAVLSNLLLVEYGNRNLAVTLPWADNRTMSLLERGGFSFALARRTGVTDFGDVPDAQHLSGWLDPARMYSERSAKPFEELLGEGETLARTTQPKKRLLPWLVADPHLHYRGGDDPGALPYAWLEGVVPKPESQRALAARDQLVPLARGIMKELVENSARHAFVPGVRSEDRPDLLSGYERSCAVVFLTEGGGSSTDRLYILVSDTGVGIVATLRSKYRGLNALPSTELLSRVLTGDWSGIVNAPSALLEANNGLSWCRDSLARYAPGASLTLVSEGDGGFLVGAVDGANKVGCSSLGVTACATFPLVAGLQ